MNDFTAMEQAICQICGIKHSHNMGILIHKNMEPIPNDKRVTGFALCEEHQKLADDGYIALIVTVKEPKENQTTAKMTEIERTGEIIHVKREAMNRIFNLPPEVLSQNTMFVPRPVAIKLKSLENAATKPENK